MVFKYYIPHDWSDERSTWEDVYLLPDDSTYTGEVLWLTISSLGSVDDPAEAVKLMGENKFILEGTDMIIRQQDFSMRELLDYVLVWFNENEIEVSELVKGVFRDFAGRGCVPADLAMKDPNIDLAVDS